MDSPSPRLRLSILGLVAISLFGALFARLWYLQVMAAPEFQVEAQANRVRTLTEEAPRGRILDVKGRVIVDNRTSLVVTVDRSAVDALSAAAEDELVLRLAETITRFGVPTKVKAIEEALADGRYDPLQPVPVAIDVPEDLLLYLAEQTDAFPGVEVSRESVRTYPEEARNFVGLPVATHLLGFVGPINETEIEEKQGTRDAPKEIAKPYQLDSDIGKEGVEATYEDELRGIPGTRTIEVDAEGDPVRTISYQAPIPGNDVQLTLDLDVQKVAEQALAEQLDAQRGRTYNVREGQQSVSMAAPAPAGSVVVTDPSNGSVRAMASYPTYDLAEWVNGMSLTRYKQLSDDPDAPLTNRAIAGQYAPGSTFKPFTAFSGFEAGLIDQNTSVDDVGIYRRTNDPQPYANADNAPHGYVSLAKSLTVSSDYYYYALGDRFWFGWQNDVLDELAQQNGYRQFGFGSRTGIPLTGEASGNIPDPEALQALYDSMEPEDQAVGSPEWRPGYNILMAVGQGDVLVTPLQLANAYGTLANGGTVYQPEVVWRVLQPNSDPLDPVFDATASVVREVAPVVKAQVALPPGYLDAVNSGLLGVTGAVATGAVGTAQPTFEGFDLDAFPVAGKTGTAQVAGKVDSSWFAAYAPAGAPQYAVAAVLEQAGDGADGGAPVTRRILEVVSGQDPSAVDDIAGGSE